MQTANRWRTTHQQEKRIDNGISPQEDARQIFNQSRLTGAHGEDGFLKSERGITSNIGQFRPLCMNRGGCPCLIDSTKCLRIRPLCEVAKAKEMSF